MHGFYNRILKIDLSRKDFSIETIGDEVPQSLLGGKGLCAHLLSGSRSIIPGKLFDICYRAQRGKHHLGVVPLWGFYQVASDRILFGILFRWNGARSH
jgi:hypothetical protein